MRNARFCKIRIARTDRGEGSVERDMADRYVTPDLVNKEYEKILELETERGSIPKRLLSTVYHCVVTECMWDAVKRFGSPTVDFKALRRECEAAVKEAGPEVFGLRLAE